MDAARFGAQELVFAPQPFALHRLLHHHADALGLERLGDEVECPAAHRLHGALDAAVRGDHHYRGPMLLFPQLLQHCHAIHPRHLQIQQHHIRIHTAQ